jgi:biotin carboxylase
MTRGEGMPQRIAAAISSYIQRLDGILTLEETLLVTVAQAAVLLGLQTSLPEEVAMAQEKSATRLLEPNIFCQRISTVADLGALLHNQHGNFISYPLIVKPVYGWASEGVCKVNNKEGLQDAVMRLWQDSFIAKHGREVVVESYVNGPEVKANMILIDGKVIFYETNDDFPSPGDNNDTTQFDNFVEVSNMIPSALPKKNRGSPTKAI